MVPPEREFVPPAPVPTPPEPPNPNLREACDPDTCEVVLRGALSRIYGAGRPAHRLFVGDERYLERLWRMDAYTMVYSCAYFREPDWTLEQAQLAKLEYVCRKRNLEQGETFLDVRCGRGSLVINAAERFGTSASGCRSRDL
jgi:cyclopropane-fatty-acyl-phospholipid synthase